MVAWQGDEVEIGKQRICVCGCQKEVQRAAARRDERAKERMHSGGVRTCAVCSAKKKEHPPLDTYDE